MASKVYDPLAINPGDLRFKVQVQQRSSTQDAAGGKVETWNTIRTTRAAISTAGMKEVFQSGQLSSQVTHIIQLRWTSVEIKPGMRVQYTPPSSAPHTYLVQAIDNVQMRNVKLNLLCLEINGGQ